MVVNGRRIFVGSDRVTGRRAIAAGLAQPAEVGVSLTVRDPAAPGQLTVAYEVSQAPAQSQLHLALVERGIVRHIGGGENSGRRLHHDNVVRAFTTIDLGTVPTRTVDLAVPEDVVRQRASVIGYVQRPDTMHILGAARVELQ